MPSHTTRIYKALKIPVNYVYYGACLWVCVCDRNSRLQRDFERLIELQQSEILDHSSITLVYGFLLVYINKLCPTLHCSNTLHLY